MFTKISKVLADQYIKQGYSICKIKNILIIKKYNKLRCFNKELFELLKDLLKSILYILLFPYSLFLLYLILYLKLQL